MPWFARTRNGNIPKSHYYICFLGAREAKGLRGDNVTTPVLERLVQEAEYFQPIKVTLQLSNKGMKIFQPVPMIQKTGRIKMEILKFLIPHHSICHAMIGPPPYSDTIAVVMLIYNPDTRCPVHVHCYRCDSAETANSMSASLQAMISRPDNAQRFADLEFRLMAKGLLPHPGDTLSGSSADSSYRSKTTGVPDERFRDQETSTTVDRLLAAARVTAYSTSAQQAFDAIPRQDSDTERMIRLHRALLSELRSKMNKSSLPLLLPPRDYVATWKPRRRHLMNGHPLHVDSRPKQLWQSFDQGRKPAISSPHEFRQISVPLPHETSSSGLGSDDSSGEGTNKRPSAGTSVGTLDSDRRYQQNAGRSTSKDKALARRYNIPTTFDNSKIYNTPLRCFGDSWKYEIRGSREDRRRKGLSMSALPQIDGATDIDTVEASEKDSGEYCDPQELEGSTSMARLSPRDGGGSNNWITKPSRFFSMEDISSQIGRLNLAGNRASVAASAQQESLRESLWHLPCLVDPFGKKCEQSSKLLGQNHWSSKLNYRPGELYKAKSAWNLG